MKLLDLLILSSYFLTLGVLAIYGLHRFFLVLL